MHHHRRKSGNTSMTDVRRAVTASDPKKHSSRPGLTRRVTATNNTGALKLGKSPRDRERELENKHMWDDEREAFLEFCMYCETQLLPSDDQAPYCSDRCRYNDGVSPPQMPNRHSRSYPPTQYPLGSYSMSEQARDIVPRASPSGQFSPPKTPAAHHVSSLKSLSIRTPSTHSPGGTYQSHQWLGRSTQTSPGSSYNIKTPTTYFPSTYDGVYYGADHYGSSTDRPLPSRRPGVYSRPKSIELVTPMLGGR